MRTHTDGKKHSRMVQKQKEGKQQAARGVYITGFSRRTRESVLKGYFEQYGETESFFIDTKKCFAIAVFKNEVTAKEVLSSPHFLEERFLAVKPKEYKPFRPRKKIPVQKKVLETAKKVDEKNDALLEVLGKCDNFDAQMRAIKSELGLQESDNEERRGIVDYIKNLLQKYIPGCTLHQFGSSINGYGIRGCDIDLFLDMKMEKELDSEIKSLRSSSPPPKLPYLGGLEPPLLREHGLVTRASLQEANVSARMCYVSRLLLHDPNNAFTDILTIPSARCPVVKFVHAPTGMKLDLTVHNRLGCRNTALIRFLSTIDERIPPLVYGIRHWSKLKQIAGNETAGPRLTNYALTWFVYFYLQNTTPPVLPSILALAEVAEEKTIIDGWDCSFPASLERVPKRQNNPATLEELFTGFLDFWLNYDFSTKMICIRTGKPEDLKEVSQEEGIEKFAFSCISAQDPFVKDHNITGNVNQKTFIRILDQFQQAYAKMKQKQFLKTAESSTWGLTYLLSSSRVFIQNEAGSALGEHSIMETLGNLLAKKSTTTSNTKQPEFQMEFKLKATDLIKPYLKELPASVDSKKYWCMKVAWFVKMVLEDVFYMETVNDADADANTTSDSCMEISEVEGENPVVEVENSIVEVETSEMDVDNSAPGDNGDSAKRRSSEDSLVHSDAKRAKSSNNPSGDDCIEISSGSESGSDYSRRRSETESESDYERKRSPRQSDSKDDDVVQIISDSESEKSQENRMETSSNTSSVIWMDDKEEPKKEQELELQLTENSAAKFSLNAFMAAILKAGSNNPQKKVVGANSDKKCDKKTKQSTIKISVESKTKTEISGQMDMKEGSVDTIVKAEDVDVAKVEEKTEKLSCTETETDLTSEIQSSECLEKEVAVKEDGNDVKDVVEMRGCGNSNGNGEDAVEKEVGEESMESESKESEIKGEKSMGSESKSENPMGSESKSEKSMESESKSEKSMESESKSEKSMDSESKSEKSMESESKSDKLMESERKIEESMESESKSEKSMESESKSENPMGSESKSEKSMESESKSENPMGSESMSENPIENESKNEKSMESESKSDKLDTGEKGQGDNANGTEDTDFKNVKDGGNLDNKDSVLVDLTEDNDAIEDSLEISETSFDELSSLMASNLPSSGKFPLLKLKSRAKHRQWMSRKSFRQKVLETNAHLQRQNQLSGKIIYLIECETSALSLQASKAAATKVIFEFWTLIEANIAETETSVQVFMVPLINEKEFGSFFGFLKPYLHRLIEKCLEAV